MPSLEGAFSLALNCGRPGGGSFRVDKAEVPRLGCGRRNCQPFRSSRGGKRITLLISRRRRGGRSLARDADGRQHRSGVGRG